MKKFKLLINPFAELDLENSVEWYKPEKEGLENEYIAEVDKTIQHIQKNPLQFGYVKKKIRMAVINRFPFGIFFSLKMI